MTLMTSNYERARDRLLKKRKVKGDLLAYVLVNAVLVGAWAVAGFGYFWPGWVLAGWGVLLALNAWDAYLRHDVSDADVQRELDRAR
jgi:hypothetical protein